MPYFRKIQEVRNSAELLEELHQDAIRDGKEAQFKKDLLRVDQMSGNILMPQVWYSHDEGPTGPEKLARRSKTWKLALFFSIINSLIVGGLLELGLQRPTKYTNLFIFSIVPVIALTAIAFIFTAQRKHLFISLAALAALAGLSGYFFYSINVKANLIDDLDLYFVTLVLLVHLFMMVSVAVGVSVLGLKPCGMRSFALLKKSFEILVTFIFYIMAWLAAMNFLSALLNNLDIQLPNLASFILSGTFASIPVLAIATVYDPFAEPENQDCQHGLSKLISNLMVPLLPAALVGLAIAIVYIPFNFWKAFGDWILIFDLTIFLFIILVLLIEATPLRTEDISPQMQIRLRSIFLSMASMSTFVDLYLIASAIKRIMTGGWSFNRFLLIGWNGVIILILALIIFGFLHGGKTRWVEGIHRAFNAGALIFIAWSIFFLTQALWLFF